MAIDDKAFIRLNYTGKVKETGDVFDTTYEEVAEEAGIKNPEKDYHPMVLAVGSSQLIPKLHEEIQKLDVGDKQTVVIPAEDAFGKRDPSKIQLIPMKEFKKQNIKPFVGMPLSLDGNHGIVRTVDGGRVRVDFNHELAGKDIVYELEIVETIEDNEEKIKGLIEVYYGNPNLNFDEVTIDIEDNIAKINLGLLAGFEQRSGQEITLSKFRVARETYENIEEIEKVQFIDEFEDKTPEEEPEEEEIPEVLNEDEE
jgi:peptidylprolyl isomerase/FKBP-type peptidyl-prolyl cis-trans isomerase SlyD